MTMSVVLRKNVLKAGSNCTLAALDIRHKIILRLASQGHGDDSKPRELRQKTELVSGVKGTLLYEKDLTRTNKKSQIMYGSMWEYFVGQASHATELWPLYGLMTCSTILLIIIFYVSFNRIEIWIDRSSKDAPIAYPRILDGDKVKGTKQLLDYTGGRMHERLPIIDQIYKDMLQAAKERGTR